MELGGEPLHGRLFHGGSHGAVAPVDVAAFKHVVVLGTRQFGAVKTHLVVFFQIVGVEQWSEAHARGVA